MSEAPEAKRVKTGRVKGIAVIKPEFRKEEIVNPTEISNAAQNDGFEEEARSEDQPGGKNKKKDRKRGQNKNRNNSQKHETIRLCPKLIDPENPRECDHGENCRYEHDVNKYLEAKVADIDGECPVYKAIGSCPSGIKCRWLGSHAALKASLGGKSTANGGITLTGVDSPEELNVVKGDDLAKIQKRQVDLSLADAAIEKMNELDKARNQESKAELSLEDRKTYNAEFFEGRQLPTEKKRLHLAGAKILSPLTTVGNLPYRRLMKNLGADITYSEMALCLPLMQGQKSEWALPRMHVSEKGGYGVQVAANKPWQAIKAAQLLSEYASNASEINLNCGCPIDLVYKQGAGSALMDSPGRAMRIIKGMNAVSGDMPVTIKMRTGTKETKNTAHSLITKLMEEQQVGSFTLHGRSRAQRYAREADWDYIREVADMVKAKRDEYDIKPWIIGNGDVYSWEDWYKHIDDHHVDSCMVARGALVKPWIFEEIDAKQYLDKSSSERLEIYRDFARYGLDHWGSDDFGVQQTRRFMCEFLSFTRRYVPVGLLEYLPPQLNERPEPWQGRNELESLMASDHYKDWIKITEMFLGPAPESFVFEPKHKSTS